MNQQPSPQWQILPHNEPPQWLKDAVKSCGPAFAGYAASILFERGINEPDNIKGFLNPQFYQPASPFDFGAEINRAIARILQARETEENCAIWGDFDADGITSTAVLWEGLSQFLNPEKLSYYIPNRLTESHGLNITGIDKLVQTGVTLIITCDTGSTNLKEIDYANHLGIDIIVTDHHSLPEQRPPVIAIVNPLNLPQNHRLFNLSGVAVAYKLIEALYLTLPQVPQRPLEDLLDLVAIGLIADLVKLTGDSRYLAQIGIAKLEQQLRKPTRPGVAKLLELCKKTGDRPTDISFGLGPRINAVSRMQGDATFCVELLTSHDKKKCNELAYLTELANARRKALQKNVTEDVKNKLAKLDLSTTYFIVLTDPQWSLGVLGLVAGQVAQEYGRPTLLLTTETYEKSVINQDSNSSLIARGSARSVNNIDLYELVKSQEHLLERFGGHPYAAGLSIPIDNIDIFTESLNHKLRQKIDDIGLLQPTPIKADLTVTVAELGQDLFQELKLLEPCGMGNPTPKLLIKNCYFRNVNNKNIQDIRGAKISYIKTSFQIVDDSNQSGFPGCWWGHYRDEIPLGRCDAIVELDFNTHKKDYEVRLIAVRPNSEESSQPTITPKEIILDLRDTMKEEERDMVVSSSYLIINECPTSWEDLQYEFYLGSQRGKKIAIAYSLPPEIAPEETWQKLMGIAKYLSRTQKSVTRQQLKQKLGLSDITLEIGLECLKLIGFDVTVDVTVPDSELSIAHWEKIVSPSEEISHTLEKFCDAIAEEDFRRRYFCQVPLSTIEAITQETAKKEVDCGIPF
jgi:single-stranded-DNA-specific exonuclease